MNVLIVGGGGYVGTSLRPALEQQHRCRHFDIRPVPDSDPSSIVGDVTDEGLAKKAVEGMDAVIYLAMGGLKDPNTITRTSFDVNVHGLYVFLNAAGNAGIRRFVYTSTLSVYKSSQLSHRESEPADEWRPYGITKRIGETLCRAAADEFPGLCAVSLRLVLPRNEQDWPNFIYNRSIGAKNTCALGPNDTRRLYLAAIACEKPGAHVVQATGDLDQVLFSHERVNALLGWLPQGD
jgi:nucleoside-diphosphate-sugar epimerase